MIMILKLPGVESFVRMNAVVTTLHKRPHPPTILDAKLITYLATLVISQQPSEARIQPY